MWIIPKNLDVSHSVRVTLELNWDLSELSKICEQSLMWRSKHSLARTWLQRLKRVSWMQHLSGRILKPLMDSRFETEYTSSLAVIPVSRSVAPESEKEQATLDTFGRIYSNTFVQLDLFGASSKTSQGTSHLDSKRFSQAYETWVTKLRQDCLQRKKLAHLIRENDYLFWQTPETGDSVSRQFSVNSRGEPKLSAQAKIGGRLCQDNPNINGKNRGLFPIPRTETMEACTSKGYGDTLLEGVMGKKGYQKKQRLNPAWVEQLMGLPQGWTNFDCLEMELSRKQQKKRLEFYSHYCNKCNLSFVSKHKKCKCRFCGR